MSDDRRAQEQFTFKNGTTVMLNSTGLLCWERNKSDKLIPQTPRKLMKVIGTAGFDNGRWIIKVESENNIDYYFEDCLTTPSWGGVWQ